MKGTSIVVYDSRYVRNVRCAGLSVLHIQKKNKSSVWSWVEVGIHCFIEWWFPVLSLYLEMKLEVYVKDK